MAGRKKDLPLVYSCSGCSSAAQMANHVALRLDREGEAEMSCIAGVGGNVPHLVRIAQSGRPILAIDGCALECTRSSLAQRGVQPARHMLLNEQGVKKRYASDFDADEAERVLQQARQLLQALREADMRSGA
ncbi:MULTISPECIES: putative zinc-binding protein [unclassified Thauera]|uniref:putative zinc-binding protein n=1 Tax=unclassified Thauera TaxID=2609274 RepID=UPI0002D10B88|nr:MULTISPECIES: putative zinc-binding protein [unclassified Thauera]ENO91525.1 DGC domain-containing protein [Thauera sp. 28]WBL63881.1 putative zinc-binding protein [Thauera sp. WB-2]HAG75969.1 zinc-binding protein [Thauera sp.]HNR61690.1 putative zinc-binding protein [Thauera sp.]HNS92639.1 putative zinc-binding protein [Thauera sp.]